MTTPKAKTSPEAAVGTAASDPAPEETPNPFEPLTPEELKARLSRLWTDEETGKVFQFRRMAKAQERIDIGKEEARQRGDLSWSAFDFATLTLMRKCAILRHGVVTDPPYNPYTEEDDELMDRLFAAHQQFVAAFRVSHDSSNVGDPVGEAPGPSSDSAGAAE